MNSRRDQIMAAAPQAREPLTHQNPPRESGFKTNPDYKVTLERSPRRVRVEFNGATIADSTNAHLLFETRHLPVYYFPRADVRMDLLSPIDEVAAIGDFVAFYWDRVDHWYEEDEEIFVHPRDPYKRVDAIQSARPVQIVVGGQVVAETRRARFLFETRLPTRYYIPPEDVRMDLLVPSDKTTACPYKGRARYYSVKIGDRVYPDLVWSYPEPIAECPKIKGYLCFFNEHVDEIRVDGVAVPKPVTPWSKDRADKAKTVPDQRGPVERP